ncbi:MAG: type I methionyl aminopeptidase [Clostridiaceae bacterium]|jgi:methionyl aminopeptidase|nr:type I methionyl aminopeptidase [Clostridiaceae bacterium]
MITIKSRTELKKMTRACEIVAKALQLVEEAIRPGITTLELNRIAEDFIIGQKGLPLFKGVPCPVRGGPDFPGTICASVNDEVIHGIPGLRELKDGDIISIDMGASVGGFCADAARTFGVGSISQEARRLIDVTEQSFFEGIKYAIKGNRISDISRAIQQYAETNGFSVVRDYVGHGIGKELWEAPQIPNYVTGNRGARLEPGMTLAIEPMINQGVHNVKILGDKWTVVTADGKLSAHYENTIAITDGEPIIMTKLRGEGI